MEGLKRTRAKTLAPEVLCKNSAIFKQFSQFKSLGGREHLSPPPCPPGGIMVGLRGARPKAFVPKVLCKNSVRLKQSSQFISRGPSGGEGGTCGPPRGSHDKFKGP